MPPESSLTYIDNMLTLFGLEKGKAPSGFVTGLLDAMDKPYPADRPSFLLLDEFMPQGPNQYDSALIRVIKTRLRLRNVVVVALPYPADRPSFLLLDEFMPQGPNQYDSDLIRVIKTRIRLKSVVVVVLTRNKDSADHLVTLHNFESIQPLIDVSSLMEIKTAEGGTIPRNFQLDWAKHSSMEWDAEAMKIAILTDHRFSGKSDKDKQALRAEIDTSLNHMPWLERDVATPGFVMDSLTVTGTPLLETTTLTPTNASANGMNQETGLGCGACHVK
jgi:hypothetical protein